VDAVHQPRSKVGHHRIMARPLCRRRYRSPDCDQVRSRAVRSGLSSLCSP
jgi:hypothetical protein